MMKDFVGIFAKINVDPHAMELEYQTSCYR